MDIKEKIEEYSDKIKIYKENFGKDYVEKSIDFKSIGASSGVYQQKEIEKFMVRPRITGGIFNIHIFEKIYELREKYKDSSIRLTSRQDFQFHNITLDDTERLMRDLYDIELYSIGTGGNTARNISASPLSGLYKNEEFDISEYAKATGEFLSKDETNLNLPRKYKVAFSSTSYDTGNVSFADLGFFAYRKNGIDKFKVVGAGGLGPKPKIAIELDNEIEKKDVLYYVDAMKQFFYNEGDRKNRARARIRHLLEKYGEDKFKEKFNFYLKKSYEKDLDLHYIPSEKKDDSRGNRAFKIKLNSSFLEETRIEGIYSVKLAPIGGWLEKNIHFEVLEFLKRLDYEPQMRLTPNQEVIFRDLGGKDAEKLISILDRHIIDSDLANSVSCVGSRVCRTGICESSETLKEIAEKIEQLPKKIRKESFKINISGCPSSCGQHQINPISFYGRLINTGTKKEQGFTLYLGGKLKDKDGPAKIGIAKGNILRRDISSFIEKLVILKYNSAIENLSEFVSRKETEILDIFEDFSFKNDSNKIGNMVIKEDKTTSIENQTDRLNSKIEIKENQLDDNIVWQKYSNNRKAREKLLNQKSFVIWMTGLSGSGKSTVASFLEKRLNEKGRLTYILDGDNLRYGINSDLQFSKTDRKENIRRVSELSKILVDAGLITICAFVSPFQADRDMVREKLGDDYIEIYIKTDIDVCKKRDIKGLYKKASDGNIKDFTGVSSPYEEPKSAEITIDTKKVSPEEAVKLIEKYLKKRMLI